MSSGDLIFILVSEYESCLFLKVVEESCLLMKVDIEEIPCDVFCDIFLTRQADKLTDGQLLNSVWLDSEQKLLRVSSDDTSFEGKRKHLLQTYLSQMVPD